MERADSQRGTTRKLSGETISIHLRPTSLAVLQYLDATATSEHVSSQSMLDIGLHVGRSVSSVRNAIDRMASSGHLKKVRRGKNTAKGVYRITALGLETLDAMGVQRTYNQIAPKPLSDVFRSPALGNAGHLHSAAPKGVGLTRKQVMELGVVRSTATLLKYTRALASLPHPLITVSLDPDVATRKLYTFHEMNSEAEQASLAYLQAIPGAAPKTHAQHEAENERRKRGYTEYLGGIIDMEHLYRTEVEPFTTTDPKHPGCQLFTGRLNNSGYGEVKHGRVYLAAHRVAWAGLSGDVRPGYQIHHWCGVRRCVDARHLDEVTPEDHQAIHQGKPCRVWFPSFWQGRPAA